MNILKYFLLFLFSFNSMLFASEFKKNEELVDILKIKNVRIAVLCNFQGTNNALSIITSSRSPAYELTNLGLAVLNDTIPFLETLEISHIYSTPAFRAQQTTNLLGKAFNLRPTQLSLDARLAMQNFGEAENQDYTQYKERYNSTQEMLEGTPPKGEPGISVFNRAQDFLQSLTSIENQTVLIVTHAFNYCHISKCLTGKYGPIPSPGTYALYDFN